MDRRGFFAWAAAAIAWLFGVKPQQITADALLKMKSHFEMVNAAGDAYGGFTVPAELAPQIEALVIKGEPVQLTFNLPTGSPQTIEQVCRLRGVPIPTADQTAADNRRMSHWRAWFRARAA